MTIKNPADQIYKTRDRLKLWNGNKVTIALFCTRQTMSWKELQQSWNRPSTLRFCRMKIHSVRFMALHWWRASIVVFMLDLFLEKNSYVQFGRSIFRSALFTGFVYAHGLCYFCGNRRHLNLPLFLERLGDE